MFPKFKYSDTPPFNLRQPYTRRDNGFRGSVQFDMPPPGRDHYDGNLDLSIHHPSTPFGMQTSRTHAFFLF